MTGGIRACVATAFLGILAKLAVGYGAYALGRDAYDIGTANLIVDRTLSGEAARDVLRMRLRISAYLGATAHLQAGLMVVAGILLAAAMRGRRAAAGALAAMTMVVLALDVPLGIVHLVHVLSGSVPNIPPDVTWSLVPRNLLAIVPFVLDDAPTAPDTVEHVVGLGVYVILFTPSFLAATVVLADSWGRESFPDHGDTESGQDPSGLAGRAIA